MGIHSWKMAKKITNTIINAKHPKQDHVTTGWYSICNFNRLYFFLVHCNFEQLLSDQS